jgi:hypothetical protein
MSKFYSKLTADDLVKALNEIYNKKVERSKPFTIICSSKMAQIYDITIKEELRLISPERATLERYAAYDNAYIHPEWDYLKYPQVYFDNPYSNLYTNEVFEEDIDGNCLIFVKRNE